MPGQTDNQLTGDQFVSENSINVSQAPHAAIAPNLGNQNSFQYQTLDTNWIGFICEICTILFNIPEGFCNSENHQN